MPLILDWECFSAGMTIHVTASHSPGPGQCAPRVGGYPPSPSLTSLTSLTYPSSPHLAPLRPHFLRYTSFEPSLYINLPPRLSLSPLNLSLYPYLIHLHTQGRTNRQTGLIWTGQVLSAPLTNRRTLIHRATRHGARSRTRNSTDEAIGRPTIADPLASTCQLLPSLRPGRTREASPRSGG